MDIFVTEPGTVAVMSGQRSLPGRIRIASPNFPSEDSIPILVSGIDYNQATNQQFQSALDGSVFIYVFGDRMGDVVVTGVAFAALCTGSPRGGIAELLKYYRDNRASVRALPIIVQVADDKVRGFLTAIKIRDNVLSSDPVAAVSNYSLFISSLPQR